MPKQTPLIREDDRTTAISDFLRKLEIKYPRSTRRDILATVYFARIHMAPNGIGGETTHRIGVPVAVMRIFCEAFSGVPRITHPQRPRIQIP